MHARIWFYDSAPAFFCQITKKSALLSLIIIFFGTIGVEGMSMMGDFELTRAGGYSNKEISAYKQDHQYALKGVCLPCPTCSDDCKDADCSLNKKYIPSLS